MEKQILHLSHWHYLTLDQRKRKEGYQVTCNGCENKISGDFYGCKSTKCKHYVCKSCVGLAPEIRHPFHTEHPLTLLAQSPYKYEESRDPDDRTPDDEPAYCSACGLRCDGFIFHCSECKSRFHKFDLHINCATLMPTTTTNNYKASEQQTTHAIMVEIDGSCIHPLIPCYRKNKQLDFLCSLCNLQIKGTIYVCLDCRAMMDESCIQLPLQITHHLHPHRTLNITRYYRGGCDACGVSKDCFFYRSGWREFFLDVRCASLMPKAKNHQVVEAPFTHPHDLIPCDITKGIFSFSCSACGLCIDGTVYVCLQCNFLLHKSCAELPLQIKHPFHPPHPLVLHYKNSSVNYQCKACKCSVLGFKYLCRECDFEMDVTCASLTYSTLKYELHHHPLAIFNDSTFTKRKTDSSVNCNSCKTFKGFPFFRCVPCDFSIKLCCLLLLPHTFKYNNHRHFLTLTYTFIKDHLDDDSDSEYYCDICEEMRELREPTYYCEDCHYIAHTCCVFHEILPLLGKGWPLAPYEEIAHGEIVILQEKIYALKKKKESHWDEIDQLYVEGFTGDNVTASMEREIDWLEEEVDAVTKEIETLTIRLDELKERPPEHIGNYQIGSIPSLGTKSSVTIRDDSDEVVEEDCNVESTKKDEDKDVGSSDVVVEEFCSVESTKKDEDEDAKIDGTFSTLSKLDEEIAAIKIMLEPLSAKLEALEKKRAHYVSHLELK